MIVDVICAWCNRKIGEKEGDFSTCEPTHGICKSCAIRQADREDREPLIRLWLAEGADQVDFRCPRCGGWVAHGAADGVWESSCVNCGYWIGFPVGGKGRKLTAVDIERNQREPCGVVGCGNRIHIIQNSSGMCWECNRAMADWEKSAKRKGPPIITRKGRLIFNPDRKKPKRKGHRA